MNEQNKQKIRIDYTKKFAEADLEDECSHRNLHLRAHPSCEGYAEICTEKCFKPGHINEEHKIIQIKELQIDVKAQKDRRLQIGREHLEMLQSALQQQKAKLQQNFKLAKKQIQSQCLGNQLNKLIGIIQSQRFFKLKCWHVAYLQDTKVEKKDLNKRMEQIVTKFKKCTSEQQNKQINAKNQIEDALKYFKSSFQKRFEEQRTNYKNKQLQLQQTCKKLQRQLENMKKKYQRPVGKQQIKLKNTLVSQKLTNQFQIKTNLPNNKQPNFNQKLVQPNYNFVKPTDKIPTKQNEERRTQVIKLSPPPLQPQARILSQFTKLKQKDSIQKGQNIHKNMSKIDNQQTNRTVQKKVQTKLSTVMQDQKYQGSKIPKPRMAELIKNVDQTSKFIKKSQINEQKTIGVQIKYQTTSAFKPMGMMNILQIPPKQKPEEALETLLRQTIPKVKYPKQQQQFGLYDNQERVFRPELVQQEFIPIISTYNTSIKVQKDNELQQFHFKNRKPKNEQRKPAFYNN